MFGCSSGKKLCATQPPSEHNDHVRLVRLKEPRDTCCLFSAAGLDDKAADCGAEAEILASRVGELIGAEYEDADCRRYVKRLRRERGHLFTFLEHDVDYHNNISERGLRPFATSRKILYGEQVGARGRKDRSWMSVYQMRSTFHARIVRNLTGDLVYLTLCIFRN